MTGRRVVVRSIMVALSLAALVVSVAPELAAAVEPSDSENRLDHPIVDVVVLPPDGADGAARILTIAAIDDEPGVRTVRMLEREHAWNLVAEAPFDLAAAEILRVEEPWFVDLGAGLVAIIATSHWQDRTYVELVRATGTRGIETVARQTLERTVDSAGAADVDGDGMAELVMSSEGVACAGTTLQVLDADGSTLRPTIAVPYALWRGVIGRFDDVAGDDLMTYAAEPCPGVSAGARAHLITTRLADGVITGDVTAGLDVGPMGPIGRPLRVDMDGDGRHEAIAQSGQGTILIDPSTDTVHAGIAPTDAWLSSATDLDADSNRGTRLHLVRGTEDGVLVEIRSLAMDEARGPVVLESVTAPLDIEDERSERLLNAMLGSMTLGGDPIAWLAGTDEAGCRDLFVPGTLVTCADGGLRPGPAWVATRPLALVGDGPEARILIASGIGWPEDGGMPTTPSPWADSGDDGRWRWGPSVAFTLGELRATDATYFQQFPVPSATLERTTSPEATINVPGFTGTRIFARAVAVDADGSPIGEPHIDRALTAPTRTLEQRTVHRIDVPPGLDAGRDGSFTEISLAEVPTLGGSRADRWSVTVIPINDWGEVGAPRRELVTRDAIGPTLAMEAPFLSAVWPLPAAVHGITEPGVDVIIEGIGPVELDRRGNFTVQAPLAPWPQTLTARATDASGNVTVREVSVIGGIDYRRLPWGTIAAIVVIAAVAISGFFGARRGARRGQVVGPAAAGWSGWDDFGGPEIEDLPPGQGLPSL